MKANDTTLTPLWLIASMGKFDLDPCGFIGHDTAERTIVLPRCGLSERWEGRVWLNPPYSETKKWVAKLADHGDGIALLLASTDTGWYHDSVAAKADAVLFMRGRPKFLRSDKSEVGLMRATMLVAFGERNAEALERSGIEGHLARIKAKGNAL